MTAIAGQQSSTSLSINGRTRLAGVVGWPVAHSLSPAMHNAAFAASGLNWCYVPLPVAPECIETALRALPVLGFAGANVTVPHKEVAARIAADRSTAVAVIGAANTLVVREDGSLWADNTDAPGFLADLAAHGVTVEGMCCLVLGAGGAARGVVYALARARAAEIIVANRTLSKAASLVSSLQSHFATQRLAAARFPDDLDSFAEPVNLIVNTTSMGMSPHTEVLAWNDEVPMRQGQIVYDLVYIPARTRLLKYAEECGAKAIGGLGMLVQQGALSFKLWTGQMPPVDVMLAAAQRELL